MLNGRGRRRQRSSLAPDSDQVPTGQQAFALELRYALMAASVNSVAGNEVSAELLAMLVDNGQFSSAQGLDRLGRRPTAWDRRQALTHTGGQAGGGGNGTPGSVGRQPAGS